MLFGRPPLFIRRTFFSSTVFETRRLKELMRYRQAWIYTNRNGYNTWHYKHYRSVKAHWNHLSHSSALILYSSTSEMFSCQVSVGEMFSIRCKFLRNITEENTIHLLLFILLYRWKRLTNALHLTTRYVISTYVW